MIPILCMILLVFVCSTQALISSNLNRGGTLGIALLLMLALGMVMTTLWVLVSKFSTNLLRDGLLWDVVTGMTFSLVFYYLGHTIGFGLKQWIGIALTIVTFLYWAIVR